jgi:hypothetical protein
MLTYSKDGAHMPVFLFLSNKNKIDISIQSEEIFTKIVDTF